VAVKIARQTNKIVLLGAPTSAAALSVGHEQAPAALRAAGLTANLQSIGYEVTDLGNDPAQLYKPDEESPRARNLSGVIAALEALKPRVEQAVKSGALPLILSGDGSISIATIAGARRYYKHVSMIYMARDAGLQTPATTSTGSVEGMVVSHLTGRGAAELVRFWGEPPLVREPDLALFGVDRLDPAEERVLQLSPVRRYLADEVQRVGVAKSAKVAIERIHGNGNPFVLHFHVDVIPDFQATDNPGTGGLLLEEVREALELFAKQDHLAVIEVTGYNPAKDPDGSGAKLILDLLSGALRARYEALQAAVPAAAASAAAGQPANSTEGHSPENAAAPPAETHGPTASFTETAEAALTAVGEAWSSESLEDVPETPAAPVDSANANSSEGSGRPDESTPEN
jgi:arginase